MKTNGNDKALESYKIFPYVAWGVTLGFAFFVYNLTSELVDITRDLQRQTDVLQMQIKAETGQETELETKTQ